MSKFSLLEYYEKYPRPVDRFKDQDAFLAFIEATRREKRVINSSYHKSLCLDLEEGLNTVKNIEVAWAMKDGNGYSNWLRVFTLLPNEAGEMRVNYFPDCDIDFWKNRPEFTQTEIAPYLFKIERVH